MNEKDMTPEEREALVNLRRMQREDAEMCKLHGCGKTRGEHSLYGWQIHQQVHASDMAKARAFKPADQSPNLAAADEIARLMQSGGLPPGIDTFAPVTGPDVPSSPDEK